MAVVSCGMGWDDVRDCGVRTFRCCDEGRLFCFFFSPWGGRGWDVGSLLGLNGVSEREGEGFGRFGTHDHIGRDIASYLES